MGVILVNKNNDLLHEDLVDSAENFADEVFYLCLVLQIKSHLYFAVMLSDIILKSAFVL